MLLIAIGYGSYTDPYTTSCHVNRIDCDPSDVLAVLGEVLRQRSLTEDVVDEIIVIENDRVLATYTSEDWY